ncbi:MAG TPA: hypothetical protein VMZ53_06145 [Kofleriaceae bacterium]|nr:hypothetical protein [Kofleriaceae bacterium]
MTSRSRRIAAGAVALIAAAVAIALVLNRGDSDSREVATTARSVADLNDPVVVEFRDTERSCITAFNGALARQRRNEIDELGLASAIEQEVLPPWQALRTKLDAATPPPRNVALYSALRRYVSARQTGWQAYVAGLRSPEGEARRHYDAYHARDAEADAIAREIGAIFRAAAP